MMGLSGSRVVITGAATGIGRTVAERFVEAGAGVHICDIDPAALAAAQEEVPGIAGTLADVGSEEDSIGCSTTRSNASEGWTSW